MRKTPPAVNPTTDRRTAKIRTKSLIRKNRNRTQRELSPSYPPSDGENRIENGNLAAKRRHNAEKIGKHGLPPPPPKTDSLRFPSRKLQRSARINPNHTGIFPQKQTSLRQGTGNLCGPYSRRIRPIKELLTQPANGRIRPRTAETPPPKAESSQSTSPGYRFAARRTRSTAPTTVAAANAARNLRNTSRKRSRPLQSQRRKTRLQRSFWKRNDPNSPPKKGLKRESALQTRPPAANERPSNDGH